MVVAIAVLAAAAPMRAWCEATCLAPAEQQSHCPGHAPAGDDTAVAASPLDDCPVLESARPTLSARLDVQPVAIGTHVPALTAHTPLASSSVRLHRTTTVFERSTPLRL